MGLSVRDVRWRATVWMVWNATALAPEWSAYPYAVELYDYKGFVVSSPPPASCPSCPSSSSSPST